MYRIWCEHMQYVPICVCTYVCMYVCMYVLMDGWMDGDGDGWMCLFTFGLRCVFLRKQRESLSQFRLDRHRVACQQSTNKVLQVPGTNTVYSMVRVSVCVCVFMSSMAWLVRPVTPQLVC